MRRSCGANGSDRVDERVSGFPTSWYGLIDKRIGPMLVWKYGDKNCNQLSI